MILLHRALSLQTAQGIVSGGASWKAKKRKNSKKSNKVGTNAAVLPVVALCTNYSIDNGSCVYRQYWDEDND